MFELNSTLFNVGETAITIGALLEFFLILVVTYVAAKLVNVQIRRFGKKNRLVSNSGIYTLARLSFYIISVLGLIAAFSAVGIDLTTFAIVAGALSVGIGFGLQSIFNNFVSGIILLLEKNVRVGDVIGLDANQKGTVTEIFVRTTQFKGESGETIIVPNSELVSKRLVNWSRG